MLAKSEKLIELVDKISAQSNERECDDTYIHLLQHSIAVNISDTVQ